MTMKRRDFLRLLGGSLLLSACRTGPLPLPTPVPTKTPAATPTPAATEPAAIAVAPTSPPGAPTATPAPPTGTPPPAPTPTPIALTTRSTPVGDFYIQTYSGEPDPRAATWSMKVDGLVQQPATLRLPDVKALRSATAMRTLECIGNPVGGSLIGNTTWKGALFTALAEKVGVQASASWAVIYGEDNYFTSVPLSRLMNPHALLAYEMGGEPLPRGHGFPLRLLAPGVYGQKQPKWITRIEFTDHEVLGTWEQKGWSREALVNPNGIVEAPKENQKLSGQVFIIRGVAFASDRGVARVEVTTDRGRTWHPAQFHRGPTDYVWTMWAYPWLLPASGKHTIGVRVTDRNGATQVKFGSVLADSFPNGASDIHSVTVEVRNS